MNLVKDVKCMEDLGWLREQIDEIDKSLVELFKRRMDIVSKVADYKIRNSMEVLDRGREEDIINRHLQCVGKDSSKDIVKEFLETLMGISRKVQKDMLSKSEERHKYNIKEEKNEEITKDIVKAIYNSIGDEEKFKVGFQGVPASFSHQALIEYFGGMIETECFTSFENIFKAIDEETIKYGVLPIENSSTGGIAEVYDLLGKYSFYIVGEKCVKVDQNLMAIEGSEILDIEEVYSHSQGFLQCSEFFNEHPNWKLIPYFNTARSAQYVSEEGSKNKACVASKKAAEVYALNILKENINYNSNNHTRFIIISKNMEHNNECNKVSVGISLPHKVGALNNILQYFSENRLNMIKIESRPIPGRSWEYFFYIDFQGNILDENTQNALRGIENHSIYFKLLGNYKSEVNFD
jgi:chorismate mutase/prephenate dehydratase